MWNPLGTFHSSKEFLSFMRFCTLGWVSAEPCEVIHTHFKAWFLSCFSEGKVLCGPERGSVSCSSPFDEGPSENPMPWREPFEEQVLVMCNMCIICIHFKETVLPRLLCTYTRTGLRVCRMFGEVRFWRGNGSVTVPGRKLHEIHTFPPHGSAASLTSSPGFCKSVSLHCSVSKWF